MCALLSIQNICCVLTECCLYVSQAQDLNVIEEVIRMMLEIINSCLSNSLHHNPNLLYALLYKRELFEQFRSHPSFQDIMQNLDTVRRHLCDSEPQTLVSRLHRQLLSEGASLAVFGIVYYHLHTCEVCSTCAFY